jgi:hypothetical protein
LLLSASSVFLIQASGTGVHIVPSLGAFRYIWCYVLFGLLFLEFRLPDVSPIRKWIFVTGCSVWVVSLFWSAETAVYTSIIWLPAYYVRLVLNRLAAQGLEERDLRFSNIFRATKQSWLWLFLPWGLLVSSIAGITSVYYVNLGHGPDWYNYIDTLFAFSGAGNVNFLNVAATKPGGEFWIIFAGFILIMSFLVALLSHYQLRLKASGLALATFGGFWASCSIYVTQNTYIRANSLLTLAICLLGLAFYFAVNYQVGSRVWLTTLKFACIVLTVSTILAGVGDAGRTYSIMLQPQYYVVSDLQNQRTPMGNELVALLNQAQVRPGTNIAQCGSDYPGVLLLAWPTGTKDSAGKPEYVQTSPYWLPFAPYAVLEMLPQARRTVYIERFLARNSKSGWLVQPKVPDELRSNGVRCFGNNQFTALINRTHVLGAYLANQKWELGNYISRKELGFTDADVKIELASAGWNAANVQLTNPNFAATNGKPRWATTKADPSFSVDVTKQYKQPVELTDYSYFYFKLGVTSSQPDEVLQVYYLVEGQTAFTEEQSFVISLDNKGPVREYGYSIADLKKPGAPSNRLTAIRIDPVRGSSSSPAYFQIEDIRLIHKNGK